MPLNIRRGLAVAVPALAGLLVIGVVPVDAQMLVTHCGQRITAPGLYQLSGDLGPCAGNGVIITADDVTFDLAGFTITGPCLSSSASSTGILVAPSRVHPGPIARVWIHGGTINEFDLGIVLSNTSDSLIQTMKSNRNCDVGIHLQAGSHDNIIKSSRFNRNGFDGIKIAGDDLNTNGDNVLKNNIANNNGRDGIRLKTGNNNVVTGNTTTGNAAGIEVFTTGNVLTANTAQANTSVDLNDANVSCDTNTWAHNTFGTEQVAGGPDSTGCIN